MVYLLEKEVKNFYSMCDIEYYYIISKLMNFHYNHHGTMIDAANNLLRIVPLSRGLSFD